MRRSLVLCLAIGLGLIALTPAAGAKAPAARGGLDRSFGENGFVRPQVQIPGYDQSWALAMAVSPDRKIYLLEHAVSCDRACSQGTFLVRLLPNGRLDPSFRYKGLFSLPAGADYYDTKIAVDSKGRVWILANEKGVVDIVRRLPDGRPDPTFGNGGRVSMSCEVCEDAHLTLRPDPRGGALIWGSRLDPMSPPYPSPLVFRRRILLLRIGESGEPEAGFGQEGRSDLVLDNTGEPSASLVGPDGAITLAGGQPCCESPEGIYLERFRSDGSRDAAFSEKSSQALAALGLSMRSRPNSVVAIIAGRRGSLTLFGATEEGGYAMRVLRNGALDQSFGRGGLKRLKWVLRAAVPAGRGRLWAVGYSLGVEGALAFVLSQNGRIDRTFGRRHFTVQLRRWNASQVTIGRQGPRGILFTPGYRGCRSFCLPQPKLARVMPAPQRHPHHRHHLHP